jgi:DNA-binding NarL/FixJ family response regulator
MEPRMAGMQIKVLLADDHGIVREGLRTLIEKEPNMEVVGEAPDGRTAVTLARKLSPHVVIMDIGMPDLLGVEATRQITALAPSVKVVALSMHSDKRYVSEMLKAGAAGYLLKDAAFEELVGAINTVLSGKTYLSPAVTDVVVDEYVRHRQPPGESSFSVLTPKEREVLQLLAEGHSTKEVAARLNVSVKTVETHRQHIMEKLDIHSIAELTKYAIREGLTSLDI